jgi:hypothetical protein
MIIVKILFPDLNSSKQKIFGLEAQLNEERTRKKRSQICLGEQLTVVGQKGEGLQLESHGGGKDEQLTDCTCTSSCAILQTRRRGLCCSKF